MSANIEDLEISANITSLQTFKPETAFKYKSVYHNLSYIYI
jgi:hypothetical protein